MSDAPGVLVLLDCVLADTALQENAPQRSRVLVGLALAYLRVFEVGELEQRLAALEQVLKDRGQHEQHQG